MAPSGIPIIGLKVSHREHSRIGCSKPQKDDQKPGRNLVSFYLATRDATTLVPESPKSNPVCFDEAIFGPDLSVFSWMEHDARDC